MYRYRFLLLAFLLLTLSNGRSALAGPADKLVQKGIDQLYNVEFDDAAKSFDAAIAADRTDPSGYFFRANVHLWSYLFDRREDQLRQYMSVSERAITIANAKLSRTPNDSRARLYLGMSYGYRAIAHARAENIMAAALSARTCYDRLNEVVRSDPKLGDAHLGLGIFHFLFGSVPEAARIAVGMSGIKGDAALGIKEITYAANNGVFFRNDARLVLALLQVYYQDNITAGMQTLNALAARYPKNVAILYAIGSAYLDKGQPDKAVSYFDKVASQGNADFATFTQMSYGRAGTAFFQKNDFARARTYLTKFLKNSREKELRAHGWYLLGLCYEFEGNRANAIKAYQRVASTPSSRSPEDVLARRRAAIRLKTPLTELDKQVMMAMNLTAIWGYKDATTIANRLLTRNDLTREQKAQLYYVLGYSQMGSLQYAAAIPWFQKAIATGGGEEKWINPFSYFYMAACYKRLGNEQKFRENMKAVDRYNNTGYDNELLLRFKLSRDVTKID